MTDRIPQTAAEWEQWLASQPATHLSAENCAALAHLLAREDPPQALTVANMERLQARILARRARTL